MSVRPTSVLRVRTVVFGALAVLALPLVLVVLGVDSRLRERARAHDVAAVDAVVARLPSGDLALSGGARWLRFPSLEEPGAAFADGIAVPDPDPAGGAMAPPVQAWVDAPRKGAR